MGNSDLEVKQLWLIVRYHPRMTDTDFLVSICFLKGAYKYRYFPHNNMNK